MQPAITQEELLGLLTCQLPALSEAELRPTATALYLIFKAGAATTPALKPAPKKQRQYTEKSVAESQKLKR